MEVMLFVLQLSLDPRIVLDLRSGKSMTFMLPACLYFGYVFLAVVTAVTLEADILQRFLSLINYTVTWAHLENTGLQNVLLTLSRMVLVSVKSTHCSYWRRSNYVEEA